VSSRLQSELKHIDFVQLPDKRILVVLVSTASIVHNKVIRVSDEFTQDELDHTARYLNQAGGAIIWHVVDSEMDALIDALLAAARPLLTTVGVWESARPPLTAGRARVSLLTAEGLHFTEGSFQKLTGDPATDAVFTAGVALMSALIDRSERD